MSFFRICNKKAINFAKSNSTKTTMLVYDRQRKASLPKENYSKPKIATVPTKKIKICTGSEVKKMCRPKPCECPPKTSSSRSFMAMCGFLMKSLIAGSVVYWTYDAGIWGDSERTEEVYTNLCHMLHGDTHKQITHISKACLAEMELRKLSPTPPPVDECSRPPIDSGKTMYKIKDAWNHAITCIFEGVTQFPGNIMRWYNEKQGKERKCIPVKTK
uniref:MICOS complex subunit MIC13 n=1 Tax=Photinus pyralis TaxID=7054 RepID=A0A1Y1LPJ6_PHOPY